MTVDKKENHLESVTKLFAFLYVLLTSCGLANRYFYYKRFGISITEYLDISEILLLFVPLVTNTVLIAALFFFMLFLMNKSIFFSELNTLNPKLAKYNRRVVRNFSLFFLTFILIIYLLAEFGVVSFYTFYIGIASWIVIFSSFHLEMIFCFLDKEFRLLIPDIWRNSLYVFILFLTISSLTGYSSSHKIEIKNIKKDVQITFKNSSNIYKSDTTNYYLGRTKGYIFFYNVPTKSSTVLDAADIREFKIFAY